MKNLEQYIDHTILKPEASENDITGLCKEALSYNFCTVCINPWWVSHVKDILTEMRIGICTVVGFPLGMSTCKYEEAMRAVSDGATEIDMVIPIGEIKSGHDEEVLRDIERVVACGVPVKVILETCLLTKHEIIKVCKLSQEAKAAFVKTSTGFSHEGARTEIVKLMKETVGDSMQVKASGGIRSYKTAKKMIEAGADRLGTSGSVSIMHEYNKTKRVSHE